MNIRVRKIQNYRFLSRKKYTTYVVEKKICFLGFKFWFKIWSSNGFCFFKKDVDNPDVLNAIQDFWKK